MPGKFGREASNKGNEVVSAVASGEDKVLLYLYDYQYIMVYFVISSLAYPNLLGTKGYVVVLYDYQYTFLTSNSNSLHLKSQ